MTYSTNDDVYLLALSAQAFVVLARPFDAVDATTATIRLKAHGFSALDIIAFEVMDGGTLPTSVSQFTSYYPIPVSSDLFRVATTPNGTPIASWASAGSGWGVTVDQARRLAAHRENAFAEINENLTAYKPPILPDPITGKYPQVLIGLEARMAARAAILSLEIENEAYRISRDRLIAQEKFDQGLLDAWRAGKPIQPVPIDQDAIPENGARASSGIGLDWRNSGML